MNDGTIEPVVFEVDVEPVKKGMKEANDAVDKYRVVVIEANKDVSDSFQKNARAVESSVDRHHGSFLRLSTDIGDFGRLAKLTGLGIESAFRGAYHAARGIESAFRGAYHAARGFVELAAGIAIATKALLLHTQAETTYEAIVNRTRAARIGFATWTEGLGGGAAVAAEIAGVIAVEKIIAATYQRGRELQRQAVEMQKSGFGYEDTVALDFAAKRQGVAPDFFNSAVKSAGGVDELAQKLKDLGEIKDPIERAHQAFLAFGNDFEKMLPMIGDRMADNIQRTKEWGLALNDSLNQRTNIGQFINDVDRLGNAFKGIGDDSSAFMKSAGNWFAGAFGSVWNMVGHTIPDWVNSVSPDWLNNPGRVSPMNPNGGDRLEPGDLMARSQQTTAGMSASALSRGYDIYSGIGRKYFAQRDDLDKLGELPGRKSELEARVGALESQLFVTDRRSADYGKPVPGSSFPGGYAARALAMQGYAEAKSGLEDIQRKQDAYDNEQKNIKKIEEAQKSLDAAVRSEQLSELSGMDKIQAERADMISQLGKTKDQVRQINEMYDRKSSVARKNYWDAVHADVVKSEKDAAAAAAAPMIEARKNGQESTFREAYKLDADAASKRGELALQSLGIQRDARLSAAEVITSGAFDPDNLRGREKERTLQQKVELEARKFQIESDYLTKSRDLQAAGITSERDARIASYQVMMDRELISESAFQMVRENLATNADLDLQKLSAKTDADIAKAGSDAMVASAKLVGEEFRRQFETIQQSAEGLFHTLFTKPSQFGKQLGNTLHEAMLKPIIEGLSKTTASVVQPIVYGSDGKSGVAGMFKGIFGGKNENPLVALTQQSNVYLATIVALMAGSMGIAAPSVSGGPSVSAPAPSAIYRGGGGGFLPGYGSSLASIAPFLQTMQSVPGGGPGYVPGGTVSSSINFGDGPISLGGSYYSGRGGGAPGGGGVSGYDGGMGGASAGVPILSFPSSGSGSSGGGANGIANIFNAAASGKLVSGLGLGAFKQVGSNLGKAIGYQGNGIWKMGDTMYGASGSGFGGPADFGHIAGSIASSPAAGAAGMMLAQAGIFGNNRGTWTGVAEGTGGGALIGMQAGGPLGAAIGAAAGFATTLGEKLAGVLSPVNEAKKQAKAIYGISIDNKTANDIVSIAKQKYAGHIAVAIRSPEVRQMLQLYSAGTGQKFPLSASTPHAGSLVEQGGQLFQAPTYQFGNPYTFQSNLSVAGNQSNGNWPSAGGPTYVSLHVDGNSTADFMNGQIASTVDSSYVQNAYSGALNASNGRLNNSAMIQQPGLIVS